MPVTDKAIESWDDDPWDVFLADDDELEPEPEPGDFWPDDAEDLTDKLRAALLSARPGQGGALCWP